MNYKERLLFCRAVEDTWLKSKEKDTAFVFIAGVAMLASGYFLLFSYILTSVLGYGTLKRVDAESAFNALFIAALLLEIVDMRKKYNDLRAMLRLTAQELRRL